MYKLQWTKKITASLIIREMQVKTTVRYHLIPGRMAKVKKSTNSTFWRGCGEREHPGTAGGNVSGYSHCGEHMEVP